MADNTPSYRFGVFTRYCGRTAYGTRAFCRQKNDHTSDDRIRHDKQGMGHSTHIDGIMHQAIASPTPIARSDNIRDESYPLKQARASANQTLQIYKITVLLYSRVAAMKTTRSQRHQASRKSVEQEYEHAGCVCRTVPHNAVRKRLCCRH